MSVSTSWLRIESWHQAHTRPHKLDLKPGATPQQIATLEAAIGVKLPSDFGESLLLHNGGGWILWYGELLSTDAILAQWTAYRDMQNKGEYAIAGSPDWETHSIVGPIKPYFWSPKRLYVTDGSGDHLTLDLDPPHNGIYGQVFHQSHEVGPMNVLAQSWSAFLEQVADDLDAGKYVYIADEDTVCPPGMY
jgi:cell wall assembly regulator SMI1